MVKLVDPFPPSNYMLEHALKYAALGWKVLPLNYINDNACSCGQMDCKSQGKHPFAPFAPQGFNDATQDREQITAWWTQQPNCNIGGRPPGVVFDLDDKAYKNKHGTEALIKLQARLGPLPETATAVSQSGGTHLYFDAPKCTNKIDFLRTELGGGLDIISKSGYTVLPPSGGIDGRYFWEGEYDPLEGFPFGMLPKAYINEFDQYVEAERNAPDAKYLHPGPPHMLDKIRRALALIPANISRDHWMKIIFAVRSQCFEEGIDLILEWSRTGGERYTGDRDVLRAYRSASARATMGKSVSINTLHLYGNAAEYAKSIGEEFEPDKHIDAYRSRAVVKLATPAADVEASSLITFSDLVSNITKEDFLIDQFIEKGSFGVMFGESGQGKTFVGLDIALSVATPGQQWAGRNVAHGEVIYVNGEGRRGLAKRCAAWQKARGVDPDEIMFHASSGSIPITMLEYVEPFSEEILRIAPDCQLVVIDTLARNFGGGDENSNQDMSNFVGCCEYYFQQKTDAAVIVIHHTGHQAKDRARGAYALFAATDFEIQVSRDECDAVTVSNSKQRDIDLQKDIIFTTERYQFTGSDGADHNSLVLNHSPDYVKPEVVLTSPLDKKYLEMITKMLAETGERLTEMGRPDEAPKVSRRELYARLNTEVDTGKKHLQRMKQKGLIELDRGAVWLPDKAGHEG